jgi:hypothetical protein
MPYCCQDCCTYTENFHGMNHVSNLQPYTHIGLAKDNPVPLHTAKCGRNRGMLRRCHAFWLFFLLRVCTMV